MPDRASAYLCEAQAFGTEPPQFEKAAPLHIVDRSRGSTNTLFSAPGAFAQIEKDAS